MSQHGNRTKKAVPATKKAAPAADELSIPMKPIGLGVYLIVGALLVGAGAILFYVRSGATSTSHVGAPKPSASQKRLTKEELEERRRHIAITQKGLASLEAAAVASANSKVAVDTPSDKPPRGATPAGKGATASSPPVSSKKAKAQMQDLDSLGADIASQLK